MNVLIACEESQVVCKEFRSLGHNAFSCDLKSCSGNHPEWHIKSNVLDIINPPCYIFLQDGGIDFIDHWDLIIAHPPCTYLSNAGSCRMFSYFNDKKYINYDRYCKMLLGREFFLKLLNANCYSICIENPLPMHICNLPDPSQIIQPYMFGHPFSKKTLLWLKNLDKLQPTNILDFYEPFIPSNTSGIKYGSGHKGKAFTSINRSKTFLGIAKAMAYQWG